MTLKEMGALLGKDERTCRVILQQPGNPFGYVCKPREDSKNYIYIVNATAVLEFAGQCNVTIETLRKLVKNEETYAEWEQILYPDNVASGCQV